jgi:hypothetical protein
MLVDQVILLAAFMALRVVVEQGQSVKMEQLLLREKVVMDRYQVFLELAHRTQVAAVLEKLMAAVLQLEVHTQQQVA